MSTVRAVVWRGGPWSLRFRWRTPVVLAAALVAVLLCGALGLLLGELGLSVPQVWAALRGDPQDPLAAYFVREVRLPRVVTAVAVGAALGVAGSLMQTVTGNPLGSPDIIGFTTGSATGALITIIVVGGEPAVVALGALLGGLLTAVLLWLLTRAVGLTGIRIVLVGLGVGATLTAVDRLLVVRASLVEAQTAVQWLAGSLNAVLWPRALLAVAVIAVLLSASVSIARPLTMLPLGDDLCRASGIRAQRVRTAAVLLAVGLVSVATAATGPIAFVALAAPQLARRLTGDTSPGLVGPGLIGALIVLGADIAAQRVFAPTQLAVGVVTGAVGGLYLVALLAVTWRRSR